MRLHTIGVIAAKEARDVLRDRRTLFFMLLLPIAVMPALIIGGSRFAKNQLKAKEARELVIAADPQAQAMVRALAQRWMNENRAAFWAIAARIGLDDGGGLDQLGSVAERVETLSKISDEGGIGDAAILAWFRSWRGLDGRQKEMLADGGAVDRFLRLTQWIDAADVAGTGASLPPGVRLPDDLPEGFPAERLASGITAKEKSVHAALHVPLDAFDRLEEQALSVRITMLYDSSQSLSKEAWERFSGFVDALSRGEMRLRLEGANLSPGFIRPFDLEAANVASDSRQLQAVLGGVLPYLIILFCFFGAFYPSLDVTAGEKERFTLETLLLAPVSRMEIATGKFLVVFAAAIIAAILSTTSMGLTLTRGVLPEGATQAFDIQFQPLAVALTTSLLLPVAALFSAMLLGVALLARSFKEAQSYAAPLQFLVILPSLAALMPDLETETKLAWIPLVNVSLLMRELLKGNYLWDFYAITMASMTAVTLLALWGTSRLFQRESVLMRA